MKLAAAGKTFLHFSYPRRSTPKRCGGAAVRFHTLVLQIDIWPPRREALPAVGRAAPARKGSPPEGRSLARRRFRITLAEIARPTLVCSNKPIQLVHSGRYRRPHQATHEQALMMKYNQVGIPTTANFVGEIH